METSFLISVSKSSKREIVRDHGHSLNYSNLNTSMQCNIKNKVYTQYRSKFV